MPCCSPAAVPRRCWPTACSSSGRRQPRANATSRSPMPTSRSATRSSCTPSSNRSRTRPCPRGDQRMLPRHGLADARHSIRQRPAAGLGLLYRAQRQHRRRDPWVARSERLRQDIDRPGVVGARAEYRTQLQRPGDVCLGLVDPTHRQRQGAAQAEHLQELWMSVAEQLAEDRQRLAQPVVGRLHLPQPREHRRVVAQDHRQLVVHVAVCGAPPGSPARTRPRTRADAARRTADWPSRGAP